MNTIKSVLNPEYTFQVSCTHSGCVEIKLFDENDNLIGIMITKAKKVFTTEGIMECSEIIISRQ